MSDDHRKTLKQIQNNPASTANGAFGARRAYLADKLHRGSSVWLELIGPDEREWSAYLGYDSLDAVPKAERELVRLYTGDKLLTSLWNGSEGSAKDIRAALNNMTRIAMYLAERKREKPAVPSLMEYLEQKDREREQAGAVDVESTHEE